MYLTCSAFSRSTTTRPPVTSANAADGSLSTRPRQIVELDDVVAGDLPLHALRQHAQVLLDVLSRFRPHAVGMRIVGAPDDVVLADQRNDGLEVLILLVRHVSLSPEVVAGLHREPERAGAVVILGVEAVEHVGEPGHARLAEHESEV